MSLLFLQCSTTTISHYCEAATSSQPMVDDVTVGHPTTTSTPNSLSQLYNQQTEICTMSQQQAINKNMFVQPPITSTLSSLQQQSQQQAINKNMFIQTPTTRTPSSLLQQTQQLMEDATDQIVHAQLGQHTEINRKQTSNSSIQTQTVLSTADCGTQTVEEDYCDFTASAKFTFNSDHTYSTNNADRKSYSSSIETATQRQDFTLACADSDSNNDDSTDSKCDDSDSTYCPSTDNGSDSRTSSSSDIDSDVEMRECTQTPTNTDNVVDEKATCLVYETQLLKLFKYCPKCGMPITSVHTTRVGTMLTVGFKCQGHCNQTWRSQPMLYHMPAGNLLLASSILLSGGTFAQISRMMAIMHTPCISASQYHRIQATYLCPVVNEFWVKHQDAILSVLSENSVSVCGDARSDSPGFSAKYTSYTLMDMVSRLIIDQQLVQVTETGSSVKMEKLGLERSLQFVIGTGITIKVLATDRHLGIQAFMKDEYPQIEHQFDVWHVAKSVKKKLTQKASKKEASDLLPWIPSISNHLYWSAQSSEGDPD